MVQPQVTVWIEPPPHDAALAGLRMPPRFDTELALRDGMIVCER